MSDQDRIDFPFAVRLTSAVCLSCLSSPSRVQDSTPPIHPDDEPGSGL